jgi:hypothetical protein
MTRPFIVEIASSGPASQNRHNDPNNDPAGYCGDRGIRADKREQVQQPEQMLGRLLWGPLHPGSQPRTACV